MNNNKEIIKELMERGWTKKGAKRVLKSLKRALADVEEGRVSPVDLGSFAKYVEQMIYLLAVAVLVWALYSIIKDLPQARYNISCHGVYGYHKYKEECKGCSEKFECWTRIILSNPVY